MLKIVIYTFLMKHKCHLVFKRTLGLKNSTFFILSFLTIRVISRQLSKKINIIWQKYHTSRCNIILYFSLFQTRKRC